MWPTNVNWKQSLIKYGKQSPEFQGQQQHTASTACHRMLEKQQGHLQLSKFLIVRRVSVKKKAIDQNMEAITLRVIWTLPAHITNPPASSIRCRSSLWSGLWSLETAIAVKVSNGYYRKLQKAINIWQVILIYRRETHDLPLPPLQITARESPTFATSKRSPTRIAVEAVDPASLFWLFSDFRNSESVWLYASAETVTKQHAF